MANKKYTLYFKGTNKYGHDHEFPIVSLYLKELDMYTSNSVDFVDLFKNLPVNVNSFIKKELGFGVDFESNESLDRRFFITDNDFTPIMNVIFEDDIDVLYVEPKELFDLICKVKMSYFDFQNVLLNTPTSYVNEKKYEFFTYLYETYVKDKPILKMIDTYDAKRALYNLDHDNLYIASIATDDDNIKVLGKKLSQTIESRRNLAFAFKKLFKTVSDGKTLINYAKMIERKNKDLNMDIVLFEMNENLSSFKNKYKKEYEENQ